MADPPAEIRRGFVAIPGGEIHYAEAGAGPPVLLLHQTPRSWAEYRDVLPLLAAAGFRAIAMDTLGYGDSSQPPDPEADSIERYAEAAAAFLAALGLERASVVGHHTGGVIAVELAATRPELVDRLVLSCTPAVDAIGRGVTHDVDDVEEADDGSHLVELWRKRRPDYPPGRRDLLNAFVLDAVKAGPRAAGGHRAVQRYVMETKLPLVEAPTLIVAAPRDPNYGDVERLRAGLGEAEVVEIAAGTVPLPDHLPEEFSAAVAAFLARG
ncbi:MAG: alpha/beta hydrolase [Actinobacteria bacterium]|nr:alpha/beta hydrolase [Actinomycetota bacterium]